MRYHRYDQMPTDPKKFVLWKASIAAEEALDAAVAAAEKSDHNLRWLAKVREATDAKTKSLKTRIKDIEEEAYQSIRSHFIPLLSEDQQKLAYTVTELTRIYKETLTSLVRKAINDSYTELEMKVVLAGKDDLSSILDTFTKTLKKLTTKR